MESQDVNRNNQNRLLIGLAVPVAAIAAFIFFHERHTLGTAETANRENMLVEQFVRSKVESIRIVRKNDAGRSSTIHLRRAASSSKSPLAEGESAGPGPEDFVLAAPTKDAADADTVAALLGELEWVPVRRTLDKVSSKLLHEMGLDAPRVRVAIVMGRSRIEVLLGANDAKGEGVYAGVLTGDERSISTAYVVGRTLFEAVDHDADHFRGKIVFPESVSNVLDATRFVRREGSATETLEHEESRWAIRASTEATNVPRGEVTVASEDLAEELRRELAELRVTRFARIDAPMVVHLAVGTPAANGASESLSTIELGGACPGHADEVGLAFTRAGTRLTGCVRASSVVRAASPLTELRETRLITYDASGLTRVELTGGVAGVLSREGDTWTLACGAGQAAMRKTVSNEVVSAWVDSLRAETIYAHAGESGPWPPVDPVAKVQTAIFVGAGRQEQLALELDDERQFVTVKRAEDAAAQTFSPATMELVREMCLLDLPRRMTAFDPRSISRVLITSDARGIRIIEELQIDSEGVPLWAGADRAPPTPADVALTSALIQVLSTLEAKRIVSRESGNNQAGLTSLVVRVSSRNEPHTIDTLTIGGIASPTASSSPGDVRDRYAHVNDGPVFVLGHGLVNELLHTHANHTIVGVDSRELAGLTFDGGTTHGRSQRRDGGLDPIGPLSSNDIETALSVLATLRASNVLHQRMPGRVLATVSLLRTNGRPVVMQIGELLGEERRVSRTDDPARRALHYVVPRAEIDPLLRVTNLLAD